jgi:predicted Zn-dependent peptidase
VVAVAGRFNVAETTALLEKTFGKRTARKEPPRFKPFNISKGGYKAPRIRIDRKETEQVQVALGWPAYGYGDDRRAALSVLSIILGGTMSSRLFMEVREKRGLAYSVRASAHPYQDVGAFTVQAGLSKAKVHEALGVIMKELKKCKTKDVTDEELNRAKEYVKGKMVLNLEESSHLADWYAKQELMQRKVESPEEKVARIFAVTKKQIREVAADILRRDRMTIAVIGPYDAADKKHFARHADAL